MIKIILTFILLVYCQLKATFSIVAIDTLTGQIGSAGASCISNSIIISDMLPGIGVIHTQSYWNEINQDSAGNLMEQGYSPQEIIDWLVNNDAENNPSIRQYGIISHFEGGSRSAYTGENCFDYKSHILGPDYSIQGNILLNQSVLDSMEYAFVNSTGNFEDKLFSALMAANISGADSRCAPYETPAISAFIRVANMYDSTDSLYLDIDVNNAPLTINPLDSLYNLFWDWKVVQFEVGDVNTDGVLNIYDLLLIGDILDENQTLSSSLEHIADLNGNEEIELTDIYLLLYIITGIISN
tara:strand:- start:505 stop:1398 length:894 start_codon:yes stop_codon:yes gene_type:complete